MMHLKKEKEQYILVIMNDQFKTRATLLMRIRDPEDHLAWAEFHEFYYDLIVGWARASGCSAALAKDVFQESMISLLRNLPDFAYDRGRGCFRSYLKTIVSRRVTDAFRREGRFVTEGKSDDDGPSMFDNLTEDGPEREASMDMVWVTSVLTQALKQAYEKVDPLTYKSFCLHVLDGLPVNVVASRLDIDREKNVYEHKRRVMDIIRREFEGLLFELDPQATGKIDESLFKQTLEEILSGKREQRMTIVIKDLPVKLFEHINRVRERIGEIILPSEPGCYLIAETGKQPAFRITEGASIGRSRSNSLQLTGGSISGHHASFSMTDRGWVLKDENSTNGMFINGKKVESSCLPKTGDIIQFGTDSTFVFYSVLDLSAKGKEAARR